VFEEVEAECIRTVERGAIDDSIRFSRRHRWKPLAFDCDGDDAVVLVAQRGKRAHAWLTTYALRRSASGWTIVHASGVYITDDDGHDPRLRDRSDLPADWLEVTMGGRSADEEGTRLDLHHAVIEAGRSVAFLEWRGERRQVADHGYVCLVWRGRSAPETVGLDADSRVVARLEPKDFGSLFERLPWHVRARIRAMQRRHPDEWINYSPDPR
jgi:hypothetical protein